MPPPPLNGQLHNKIGCGHEVIMQQSGHDLKELHVLFACNFYKIYTCEMPRGTLKGVGGDLEVLGQSKSKNAIIVY